MSLEETSALLGIQAETVKTRLHRARRLLRQALERRAGPLLMTAFPFDGWRCERMTQLVLEKVFCRMKAREPIDGHDIQSLAKLIERRRGSMVFAKFVGAAAVLTILTMSPQAQAASLTDPQIAHIAYTAGVLDVEAAKLALKKSQNMEVIAFAQSMVHDHEAVNDRALALVKKLKITPEDNDVSKGLVKQADTERAARAALDGAAFDKAYTDNEVAYHKSVNAALETKLIPDASNAELKSLLQTGLKIFQGHEQHAEHLVGMLK